MNVSVVGGLITQDSSNISFEDFYLAGPNVNVRYPDLSAWRLVGFVFKDGEIETILLSVQQTNFINITGNLFILDNAIDVVITNSTISSGSRTFIVSYATNLYIYNSTINSGNLLYYYRTHTNVYIYNTKFNYVSATFDGLKIENSRFSRLSTTSYLSKNIKILKSNFSSAYFYNVQNVTIDSSRIARSDTAGGCLVSTSIHPGL